MSLRVACQVETCEIFPMGNMESWKVVSDSTRQQDSRRKQRDKLGFQAKTRRQRCQGTDGTWRELERTVPSIPLQTAEPEDKEYDAHQAGAVRRKESVQMRESHHTQCQRAACSPFDRWWLHRAPAFLKCKCSGNFLTLR